MNTVSVVLWVKTLHFLSTYSSPVLIKESFEFLFFFFLSLQNVSQGKTLAMVLDQTQVQLFPSMLSAILSSDP